MALLLLAVAAWPPGVSAQISPPSTEEPPVTTVPITEPPTTERVGGVVTTAPRTTPTSAVKRSTSTSSTVPASTTIFTVPTPEATPTGVAPAAAPKTGTGQISGTYALLSLFGFVAVAGLLGLQWYLTRPGRRGWTL